MGRGKHTTGIVGRRQQRGAARSIASLTRSLASRVAARAAQTNTTEPEEKSALQTLAKHQAPGDDGGGHGPARRSSKHRATMAAATTTADTVRRRVSRRRPR